MKYSRVGDGGTQEPMKKYEYKSEERGGWKGRKGEKKGRKEGRGRECNT